MLKSKKFEKAPKPWQSWRMLKTGEKIIVYDSKKAELGEGTFLRQTSYGDLKMIAYECKEHTILAKGPHYLKVNGQTLLITPDFDK